MKQLNAWINWSEKEQKWVLRLWLDDEWQFSKSWAVRDTDHEGGAWVYDGILCEIAHLQDLGYSVKVTLG